MDISNLHGKNYKNLKYIFSIHNNGTDFNRCFKIHTILIVQIKILSIFFGNNVGNQIDAQHQ